MSAIEPKSNTPTLVAINPATGRELARYPMHDAEQVELALAHADESQRSWARVGLTVRAAVVRRAASVLRERAAEYAELMADEMGKVLSEGRAEVDKCAWACEFYAEHAESFLAPDPIETDACKSMVVHRPLGLLLAVMPWNFPLWQVVRAAAPALMAGNAILLKHASNVPGSALAIEKLFRDAGLPSGLFTTLLIDSDATSDLIGDERVRAVTLTGSTGAGRAVAARAGEMLKPCVLELGGSDPYVVLKDADVEAAARCCVKSRLINAGQSCIAAKRFIVVASVRDAFESECKKAMSEIRMGDPKADAIDIGPQAREELRDELHGQVAKSIEQGARCLLGGEVPEGEGAFYPPTLLTDVQPGMPAYDEELFGPVGAIIVAEDEADALRIANDTTFGLGAAVFTADLERGERIAADELDAGCCFVNTYVRSDPRLPFGGIKDSGFGRELSRDGILAFVNRKTVYVSR